MLNKYLLMTVGFGAYSLIISITAYSLGGDAVEAKYTRDMQRKIDAQRIAYNDALTDRRKKLTDALAKIKELEQRPQVMTNEIIEAVNAGNCKRVSDDVIRLLNDY